MDEITETKTSVTDEEAPPPYHEVSSREPEEHVDSSVLYNSSEITIQSRMDNITLEDENELDNKETSNTVFDNSDKNVSNSSQANVETVSSKPKAVLQRTPSINQENIIIPKVNCQEKIIFCIDHSSTMFSNHFRRTVQSIKQTSTFHVLNAAIREFVMTKSFIDKRHEYSLFMLNDDAQLITDFSSQGEDVIFMLQDIMNSSKTASQTGGKEDNREKYVDLSALFEKLAKHISLPHITNPSLTPPPYVVRVIMVYGRSDCKLEFCDSRESFKELVKSPYFFFDCIYVHEEPAEDNDVMDIFTRLCALDTSGTSHIFELSVDGSMSALYNAFAKLLAHPLQRQRQGNSIEYDIASVEQLT